MSQPSTQIFKKQIDITALTSLNGSEVNQLFETGLFEDSKGGIIYTIDTALDTPNVPDPDLADGMGVIPIWLKRFIWMRIPFDDSQVVKLYTWHPYGASVATFLQWIYLNQTAETALTLANANGDIALDAQTVAGAATVSIANLTTRVEAVEADVETLQTAIANLAVLVTELQARDPWPVGTIRMSGTSEEYSVTEDEGWLVCDGKAVDREVFADLYNAIGINYGNGDGNTTFNVPDFRARSVLGENNLNLPNGAAGGLTSNARGSIGGVESVTLTGQQSGIQQHAHEIQSNGSDSGTVGDVFTKANGATVTSGNTQVTGHSPALSAHTNLSPYAVAKYLIKT